MHHLSVNTHVINLSLLQGIVPDVLKSARVIPLFTNMTVLRVNSVVYKHCGTNYHFL